MTYGAHDGSWIGLSVVVSGQAVFGGGGGVGRIYSVKNPAMLMNFEINRVLFGPRAGAAGEMSIVFADNIYGMSDLMQAGGFDFNISAGPVKNAFGVARLLAKPSFRKLIIKLGDIRESDTVTGFLTELLSDPSLISELKNLADGSMFVRSSMKGDPAILSIPLDLDIAFGATGVHQSYRPLS